MLDNQQIDVPANRPDDCSTEQPPKCDATTACSVQPPNDEAGLSDVVTASKDDDAVGPAPPLKDDAGLAPPPNNDAGLSSPPNNDAGLSSPPNDDAGLSSPSKDDAGPAPLLMDDDSPAPTDDASPALPSMDNSDRSEDETIPMVPKDEPGSSNANGSASKDGDEAEFQLKEEIKHETIDLGNDTYFYDDNNKAILVKGSPKVGFDRGLEPDHIVGATEVDGKLMFLMAWKNSEVADLLESTVIYDRCPQIAIQFFEARLRYCPDKE